jgi:hypothetical protein
MRGTPFLGLGGTAHITSQPVTQRAGRAVSYCIVLPRDAQLASVHSED